MKVLVVEDDEQMATTLRRGLVGQGFAVDLAGTGPEGLWLAGECDYGAILLDLMLPGRDGFGVCADLRQRGDWTPVLVLTAREGKGDVAEALRLGADDYLTKPFSFLELVARLHALARRSRTRDPEPLTAGDLRLDPLRRRTWRGAAPIELTARQFQLLEFLMRRRGRVLSKSDILGGVWDFDFEGDPNIVEVYIRRLRARVDEPFGRHAIETVRGAGYRLDPDGG